jgi:hypothetical protein
MSLSPCLGWWAEGYPGDVSSALNEQETIRLRESAQVIRQALDELEDEDSHTKAAS